MKKWIILGIILLSSGWLTACSSKAENVDVSDELQALRKEVTTTVVTGSTTIDSSTTSVTSVSSTTSAPTMSSPSHSVFPEGLLGTWRAAESDFGEVIMEFSADGQVLTQVETNHALISTRINSVEEVGPYTYRYHFAVGEQPFAVIPSFQLGGVGVKYDYGFKLENSTLTLLVWSVQMVEDFDYSNPLRMQQLTLYKE